MYSWVPVIWSVSAGPRCNQGVRCRSAPKLGRLGSRQKRTRRSHRGGAVMLAMETEPPAPLQGEEELGERAATTPSSMAAAVMLAALPQAHPLAPAAHGAAAAAAAVVPLALGQGHAGRHAGLYVEDTCRCLSVAARAGTGASGSNATFLVGISSSRWIGASSAPLAPHSLPRHCP